MSKTTIEKAVKVVLERFSSLKVTFGCSHTETLSILRELVLMYMKLENYSLVMHMLRDTTFEIISREKHSKALHEAAKTIGSIFIACGMTEQGREMIQEARLQIITGSAGSEKSSFKIDKSTSRVCYVFLVTFEQTISEQLTMSYSELMADLLTETIFYESFSRSINNKSSTEVILARAASLRAFLVPRKRKEQIDILDNQAHGIFVQKWESILKVRSEISAIFCRNLLYKLGRNDAYNADIGHAACVCSVAKVRSLLGKGQVQQAYEVAFCALNFISQQRAYHQLQNVEYGIELSGLMADRGPEKLLKPGVEPKLRKDMMELSRKITQAVLQACKESKVDFVRFQLRQLRELTGLLGAQQNHVDLEVRQPLSIAPLTHLTMLTTMIQTVAPPNPLVLARSPKELVIHHHHLHRSPLRPSHLRQQRTPPQRHPALRRHLLQPPPRLGLPGPQDAQDVGAAVPAVHEHGPLPRGDGRARERPAARGRRRRRRRPDHRHDGLGESQEAPRLAEAILPAPAGLGQVRSHVPRPRLRHPQHGTAPTRTGIARRARGRALGQARSAVGQRRQVRRAHGLGARRPRHRRHRHVQAATGYGHQKGDEQLGPEQFPPRLERRPRGGEASLPERSERAEGRSGKAFGLGRGRR